MESAAGDLKSVLECRHISKEYQSFDGSGTNQVLKDMDFRVRENEFLVLFGPGQCGKTTLLNLLAGLEPSTAGEVMDHGKRVNNPSPKRGVVYQKTALFPWLTVMGNVEFGPKVCGKTKRERKQIADHYIDLVGLKGFEKSFPSQLSGGMRQRVGIARAYSNNPDLLLMDEPFGHLDAQTRYMMEEELQRIWQKEKRTVVFVTNNIEEALFLADRIILMTNCPSSVKKEYVIDLPHPRNYVDPEFLRLRREITENMDKSL